MIVHRIINNVCLSHLWTGSAVPVTKKKRIEEVKLAFQEQLATDSPDESADDVLEVRTFEPGHIIVHGPDLRKL